MSAVVPSLNVPVTTIRFVWPTDAIVTFAGFIVADTSVGGDGGGVVDDGVVGDGTGVEPPHDMDIIDNAIATVKERWLRGIAAAPTQKNILL